MILHFTKFHGSGNDFILVDGRKNDMKGLTQNAIERLCDRHFGIGADGLIILARSDHADFSMIYYNSDGRPGTMCGNGGRCLTAYARMLGIFDRKCKFEAADGMHTGEVLNDGNIKLSLNNVSEVKRLQDGYFMDTGSPHFITFRSSVSDLDVMTEGRKMRSDPRFVEGTNVNFLELTGDRIIVRTYERGVEEETLSCGTGVTASAIAACLHEKLLSPPVEVETAGGKLLVEFIPGPEVTGIYLTGPAIRVFEGNVQIPVP